MTPTRSAGQRMMSTNPIAFSCPGSEPGDGLTLDMATAAVAVGKLEIAAVRGRNYRQVGRWTEQAGKPETPALPSGTPSFTMI